MVDPLNVYNKTINDMCAEIAQGRPVEAAFNRAHEEYRKAITPSRPSDSHAALIAELTELVKDRKRLREIIIEAVTENRAGRLHPALALSKIAAAVEAE